MSATFVTTLRARPEAIELGLGHGALSLRVEMPERWDVVRITAEPTDTVLAVKIGALAALMPGADHRRWVMKLRGREITNESETLAESTARNGSTFLITLRRRRPVR
jgi:hypothetical protein